MKANATTKRELSFANIEFPREFFSEDLKNEVIEALKEIPFEKISIMLNIPRNVIGTGDSEYDTRLVTCGFIRNYKASINAINFKIHDKATAAALAGAGRYICIVPLVSTANGRFKRILKLILCTQAFVKHSGYSFVINSNFNKEESTEENKPKHVEKKQHVEEDEVVWDTSTNMTEDGIEIVAAKDE
jgi:hypothetical protein